MMKTLMRSGVAALLVGSFALTALPASADGGVADALSATPPFETPASHSRTR